MEEQIIKTISAPRITLKRTSIHKKIGWEIASSSPKDEAELKLIAKMITNINEDMEKAFPTLDTKSDSLSHLTSNPKLKDEVKEGG